MRPLAVILLVTLAAFAQTHEPSVPEQQALMQALSDGASSPLDTIRALEAYLARFPQASDRSGVEGAIARAAIQSGDWDRVAKYGEPALALSPGDAILLDGVSQALLAKKDKAAADRAYKYARTLEDLLDKSQPSEGRDAAHRQDEHDLARSQALLYQARARAITGEPDEAVRLTARAFSVYPNEEAAREWAEALHRNGRTDDAIEHLAEAFMIPDARASDAIRLSDRVQLGEWFMARHASDKGLGDLIVKAYDRMSQVVETRRTKLLALEPNAGAQSPLDFALTALNGKPFRLASLKGNIVILDFWATWCIPCRVQRPLIGQLKERFPAAAGVVFLDVNADEDRHVVEPFLTEQKWDKNTYFEDGLVRLFRIESIPATILLDRQGKVVSRLDGFDPETFLDQMTKRIQGLVDVK